MTNELQVLVRAAAVEAYRSGICVLPAAADGSKRPAGAWRRWQTERPDDTAMHGLFPAAGGPVGLGFVCGAVSGGLELFEFDSHEAEAAYRALALEAGEFAAELVARLDAGYSERTPGGGLHWLYRAEGGARGNTKLARAPECKQCGHLEGGHYKDDAGREWAGCIDCAGDDCPGYSLTVLIETRGEGGWVVVAPSGGPTHPSGRPYAMLAGRPETIPTLTDAEREVLWGLARALNTYGERDTSDRDEPAQPAAGELCAKCGQDRTEPEHDGFEGDVIRDVLLPIERHAFEPPLVPVEGDGDERPGEAFNRLATWAEILEPAGWRRIHTTRAGEGHWNRPGAKDKDGIDATTDANGHPYFYVFSTSVPAFETERGYDKFGTYAIIHHGGDVAAAARAVAGDQRYGGGGFDPGPLVAPRQRPSAPAAGNDARGVLRDGDPGGDGEERDRAAPAGDGPSRPVAPVPVHALAGGSPGGGANGGLAFKHAFPPDHFVTRWIEYGASQCDAAYEYHEACALVALACVVPGLKAHYSYWPRGLAPNLYAMLLGPSSTSRKSTAVAFVEKALEAISERTVLPERMSPEATIEQLAMRQGGASLLVQDELGKSLAEWGARNRPQGQAMLNVLLSAYDGKPIRYARHSKRVKGGGVETDGDYVERSHLSVLGAATPSIYGQYGIAEMTEDGLLPRFAIVMPRNRPPERDMEESAPPGEDSRPLELWRHLEAVYRWTNGHDTQARLTPEALGLLRAYMRATDRQAEDYPILGRIGPMAFKVAMLAAAGDAEFGQRPNGSVLTVRLEDVEAGITVARSWAANATEFVDELRGGGHNPDAQRAAQAVAFIRRNGGTVRRRDVMRALKWTAFITNQVEETLVHSGAIEVVAESKTAGKAAQFWRLLGR